MNKLFEGLIKAVMFVLFLYGLVAFFLLLPPFDYRQKVESMVTDKITKGSALPMAWGRNE